MSRQSQEREFGCLQSKHNSADWENIAWQLGSEYPPSVLYGIGCGRVSCTRPTQGTCLPVRIARCQVFPSHGLYPSQGQIDALVVDATNNYFST
jgi:hypothetical protein